MKKIAQGVVLFAGLLAVPSSKDTDLAYAQAVSFERDPRLDAIRDFFSRNESPAAKLAEDFLIASDEHGLDWRLLPSICFVESGGGKVYQNNNIMGWDSCKTKFSSLREGIHYVGYQLAHAGHYRRKTVEGILRTYNPRAEYTRLVKSVMTRLGPREFESADAGE